MATALAAQLAKIRASTISPLDLKAQKKAHSQSLLFEARVAENQDFDTIYQICYEGFQELCKLDARFHGFANNIFSEQSKQEDRTQMTAAQNEELDAVLEEFMGLVGCKLLLKPAIKALEWPVRRFRAHEHNTVCLVMTFLPYHKAPIFPIMLDILPQKIPPVLKFLHPYIRSRANPPRPTIVYTATHNQTFFAAMNTYSLKVIRRGHYHPILIAFWSAVSTEAIAAMLDQSRSGRLEAQKQLQEDIVLRFLPVLHEGLSLRNVADLRVGCYMIFTVLASKASLDDMTLSAMMESTVSGWRGTTHAGLICLAVLAQHKRTPDLPRKVFKALMAVETLIDDLSILKKRYKVDNLVLGLLLEMIKGIERAPDATILATFRSLTEADLMGESFTIVATRSLLSMAQHFGSREIHKFDLSGSLGDLILQLADSKTVGYAVQQVFRDSDLNIEQIETNLQRLLRLPNGGTEMLVEDVEMNDVDKRPTAETLDMTLSRIPTRTAYEISFLSHSDSYVFPSLAHAFFLMSCSPKEISTFSDLPVLRKSLAMTEPLFVSFFIRIWCGKDPATARVAAIDVVTELLKRGKLLADVQIILPYIIYALADPSAKVRRASAELILVLAGQYQEFLGSATQDPKHTILGQDEIYGQGKEAKEVSWMTITETAKFIHEILVPGLEEFMLDASHMLSCLSDNLSGSKHFKNAENNHKGLKTSLRAAIFSFLCSHVINTPLFTVKHRLLQVLNRVTKVGSLSRTKLLLPLLEMTVAQSQNEFEGLCDKEDVNPGLFLEQIVGIVAPAERDGIHLIQNIMRSESLSTWSTLCTAVLKHVQNIWPSLKHDLQLSLAKMLLGLAVAGPNAEPGKMQQNGATETLRSINLPTNILISFLEELPSLAVPLEDKPSASKRRRMSHSHIQVSAISDPRILALNIKRTTVVQELIESSKPERHPELLKSHFQLLADIQHYKQSTGTELSYLQALTLDNTYTIVDAIKSSPNTDIDRSAIRADVIIDCIRTNTNPQVQHTALLLISGLASLVPEMILHSVMPVFTYMGANVLRQNDEYSAFVVKQTMESVIPRLVRSLHKREGNPLMGTSELLLSFVAAYEHIPAQRRLDLFNSLTEKLGATESLFALLVLLKEKYPTNKKVTDFAVELSGYHGAKAQLLSVEKYLEVVLDTFKPTRTSSLHVVSMDNGRTPENAVANLLPLPSMILSAERLVTSTARILRQEKEEANFIRAAYGRVFEQVFVLSEMTKHSKKLSSLCASLLQALLGLFSMSEFIGALQNLFGRTGDDARQHLLKSFERRLSDSRFQARDSQEKILAFLPQVASLIEEPSDLQLKRTAIACIDRATEIFGKKDMPRVAAVAATVAGPACLGAEDSNLRVMALLCLATIVEILRDAFVPIIPQALPKATEYLAASIKSDIEDERLHNAAYSFISNLLQYVPWMITGPALDRFLAVSYQSANGKMGEDCDRNRVNTLRLLAEQMDPKELFAALERTWTSAMIEGPIAAKEHLQVLRLSISHQPKTVVSKHSSTLVNVFIKALDLRRIQFSPRTEDSYEQSEVEDVEDAINGTAIAMIYKLNDTTFRPLYLRMMAWATALKDGKKGVQRRITWWTFLGKFFGTLKSIVTNYASFIPEDAVEILKNANSNDAESRLLWQIVVPTLHRCFEHDQDGFWQSPIHFDPISTALLASLPIAVQLTATDHSKGSLSSSSLLVQTITALAAATADAPAHQKFLNTQILAHMRNDSATIRLLAVRCERALTDRLGEEWLGMLPEMLPVIAEGLEDDDESVEAEVRAWVRRIEEVLGEKLDDMLN